MLYVFDEFSLHIEKRLLFRNGEVVHIPAKVLDTLILLVEARGGIVTKEDMIRALWPDTVVEEGGIARNISMLRKLLDEHSTVASIQTLPRRGYRFVRDIREVAPVLGPEESDTRRSDPINERTNIDVDAKPAHATAGSTLDQAAPRRRVALPALIVASAVLLIAIVAIGFALLRPAEHTLLPFVATPVTTNSYHLPVTATAISPDGRMVIYVEASELFVRIIDSNEVHRLAVPERAVLTSVSWFPDNTRILLGGYDHGSTTPALWSVSALGGKPKLLIADASSPTIAPSGEIIAFHRAPNEVWLVHPDGSGMRSFATAPQGAWFNSTLQFSPDGTELLIHRYVPDDGHFIDAHRLRDGEVTTLFESSSGVHGFALLPKRELLVVEMLRDDAVGTRLLALDLDRADPRASARTLLEAPGFAMYSLSATANGERVVLVKDKVQSDVYVADLDRARTRLMTQRRLTLDDSNDMPSAWFPDGRSLLFHSNRGSTFGVYRQSIDSENAEPLIVNGAVNRHAFVIPARGEFWYLSTSPTGNSSSPALSLVATALDLIATRTVVTRSTEYLAAQCAAANARCVLAEHTDSENVFHSLNSSTGELQELHRMQKISGAHFHWALSADGDTIALIDPLAQNDSIQLLDISGREQHRSIKLDYAHPFQSIAWDPLGDGFFLTSAIDRNRGAILRVTTQGEVIVLNSNTSPRTWVLPSPDGTRIAFQAWTNNGNVWLLQR